MKIQLASDLHLEFLGRWAQQVRMIEPAPGDDLLVLAGGIHRGTKALEVFVDWPVLVRFYVEHLGADFGDYRKESAAYDQGLQLTVEALQAW